MNTCEQCQITCKGRFCSRRCCIIHTNKARKKTVTNKCLICNKETSNPKFCSIECSKQRGKNNLCETCGQKTKNKKYCSTNCNRQSLDSKLFTDIENEVNHNIRTIKRYLIFKFGDKCSICSIETWCGKPLTKILDHIDGDSSNNKIDNLRLVCSNCDSQLPTYKNKNKGNGRHFRRKRYQNGQSY